MGRDKAQLVWGGETFLDILAEKTARLGLDPLLISSNRPRHGYRSIPDYFSGAGPLAGIHACLENCTARACLVLAADAPQVPEPLLRGVLDAWRAAPERPCLLRYNGWPEPLISVFPRESLPILRGCLAAGERRVAYAAGRAGNAWYEAQGPGLWVRSVNTPEEYRAMSGMKKR